MKRPVSDGCLDSLGGVNFGLLLAGNVAFTVLLLLVSVELLIVRKFSDRLSSVHLYDIGYVSLQRFKQPVQALLWLPAASPTSCLFFTV